MQWGVKLSETFTRTQIFLRKATEPVRNDWPFLLEVSSMKPVLKYPGSKWNIAKWIISFMPPHTTYLEPFFGSGAVFFQKPPSKVEMINDIDGNVVNLFRVIREHPEELAALIEMTPWARDEYYASYEKTGDSLEDARRFLVRCWQAF